MKQAILRKLIPIACLLVSMNVLAYDFESGGIYYNITSTANKTVEVTYKDTNYNSYTGEVVIPSIISLGETYTVTSIGERAFYDCTNLTYIELPSTIISVGNSAFYWDFYAYGSPKVNTIKCNAITPPTLGPNAFWGNDITLEVPFNSILAYQTHDWKTVQDGSAWGHCQSFTYKSKEHDGLYYLPTSETEVKVTSNPSKYTGDIEIPTEITVDDKKYNVTSIANYAFQNCNNLTNIVIPESVTSIGINAFEGTAWYNNLSNGVIYINNVLYKYKGTMPENTSIAIKEGTISISGSAFRGCTGLTNVTIPEGVISIGGSAFYGCYNLTYIELPSTITTIGAQTFYHNYYNNYAYISRTIKCHAKTPPTLESSVITCDVFCYNELTLEVPIESFYAYKAVEGWAKIVDNYYESWGESTRDITYKGSELDGIYYLPISETEVEVISNPSKYTDDVVVPAEITVDDKKYTVTSIGNNAFYGCTSLTSIELPSTITSIGTNAFYHDYYNDDYTCIDRTIKCNAIVPPTIQSSTFDYNNLILEVPFASIPAYKADVNWTEIKDEYGNATGSITYKSKEVEGIYYLPTSDTEVEVLSNPSKYTGDVVIPAEITVDDKKYTVTSIGNNAFYGCTSLTSIELPSTITSIGTNAFYNVSATFKVPFASALAYKAFDELKNKTFEGQNIDGLYYLPTSETEVEVTMNPTKYSGDIVIPDTISVDSIKYKVTSIGYRAFYNCSNLTSIDIPESISFIGPNAFVNCSSLTSLTIPSKVGYFDKSCCSGCTSLKTLIISDSEKELAFGGFITPEEVWEGLGELPTINGWCFYGGDGSELFIDCPIDTLYIGRPIYSYSDGFDYNNDGYVALFASVSTIANVTLSDKLTSISDELFKYCYKLTSITIPDSVTSIGRNAFYGCNISQKSLDLPSKLTSIGEYAFSGINTNVVRIGATTPPTITSTSLPSGTSLVLVPEGTPNAYKAADVWSNYTIIAEGSCDIEVTNTTGGELAKSILTQTRKNLQNITGLKVHGSLNSIDLELINTNMTSLLNLDISDTDLTEIPAEAFKDITTLMSVKLPNVLQTIGDYAFSGCKVLSGELVLPEKLVKIGNYAFQNCSCLSDTLRIPTNVTKIGYSAFSGCINYTTIDMTQASKLVEIGDNAFSGCSKVENVDMSGASRLINLGTYIFNGCYKLKNVDLSGASSLSTLSSYIFYDCSALESVQLPNTLKSISDYAFYNCTNLETIKLPAKLEAINSSAFAYCTGLTSVDFSACSALSTIYDSSFYGCTGLTMLDLSACESLITINSNAFNNCSALQTVNFPTSLVSIGNNAFANCTNLLQLSVPCTIPPVIENHAEPFAGVDNIACILSIPSDNFFDYYSANYWGGFVDVESKSEIQNTTNNPADEESDDTENGENTDNDVTDGEEQPSNKKHHNGCGIYFKKHKGENSPRLKSLNSGAIAETETSSLGLTADGQSLFVEFGESVTYYLVPDEGKEIESVFFNGVDVTSQLVNNTYTATVTSDMPMTDFVINLKNASPALLGDINSDGEVNVTDIVALYSFILGNTEGVSESIVDLNGDGEVNVTDIVKLYSLILNESNNN